MTDIFDADPSSLSVTGGCLCAEVSFRVTGPLAPVVACHCSQCRRASGHFIAGSSVARDALEVEGEVRWYQSSEKARRGFCPICGSNLFWDGGGDRLSIFAGSLDAPTGLSMAGHIFCADKGEYYEIADGLPQSSGADPDMEKRGS
ncbi:GFA family protein [Palleronia sp.]|uniref:GFA family protein n=1 Tax=Palleronia sp. TaxID=1940284 RepID=UPI0035C7DEE2